MRQCRLSPTLSKLLNAFENFSVEALGKVFSQLVCGGNLKHFNISVANVVQKEVPLNQDVLGADGNALLGSKQQSTIVVFKDLASNGTLEVRWQSQFHADFSKKITKWQQSPHACTESRVLRFQCGQGDLCLQLRLPENWTTSKGNDEAGVGLGANVRIIRVTTMESSKVSINITIKREVSSWSHNSSLVSSAIQVVINCFDCMAWLFLGE
ncbi:hypothetical protein MHU86_15712 [Fragilaria crotonensis]|nr:hypothetical protein MHU86_15712 [Fragilaria crotonensis]